MKNLSELIKNQAAWVMEACDRLGKISQSNEYIDRQYLTKEHRAANRQVSEWMHTNNMHTWEDGVGNVWGRLESNNPKAKSLIMGSHLDTVVNGGRYDGMLGVIAPIALVEIVNSLELELPFHLDIVGFCDEEGTRFGSTLLGSRALTGKWQDDWADFTDADGISLRQAMLDFGLDFEQVNSCQLNPEDILAFVETHIEQGPVLENNDLPVGVVTAIAGAKRLIIKLEGMAGHAGTVPMKRRQDTLVGASEMILAAEKYALQANVLATVGRINNAPNAINVISGYTEFSLDIRSDNDHARDKCLELILSKFNKIAEKRSLIISTQLTHDAPAVLCTQHLIDKLAQACYLANIVPEDGAFELLSGAGHDAMAMADICETGMLFVRCEKGISHNPKEAIIVEDVEATLNVLLKFITHQE